MSRSFWSDGLTWAANSGMFVWGVVLALLGALLPTLSHDLGLEPFQAGSLFLFLNCGALLITLASGPAFDRFGFRTILLGSSAAVTLSLLWMGGSQAFAGVAAAAVVLGLGGGGLNIGTNALVGDLYPGERAAALNRLGMFFGLGTFTIPLLVGLLLRALPVGAILLLTALAGLVPGLLFALFPAPPAKHATGFPLKEAASLLRERGLLLLALLLFFESGNEITTGGWMSTFLVERASLAPATASLYLSLFWAAVAAGRIAAGRVLEKRSEARLIQICALGSAASLLVFILLPGPVLSALTAFCVGFFLAPIFPSVLGQAGSRYPSLSGTVLGGLMSVALVGGMLTPWATGFLVQGFGPGASLLLPVAGFLAVFLIQTVIAGARD